MCKGRLCGWKLTKPGQADFPVKQQNKNANAGSEVKKLTIVATNVCCNWGRFVARWHEHWRVHCCDSHFKRCTFVFRTQSPHQHTTQIRRCWNVSCSHPGRAQCGEDGNCVNPTVSVERSLKMLNVSQKTKIRTRKCFNQRGVYLSEDTGV